MPLHYKELLDRLKQLMRRNEPYKPRHLILQPNAQTNTGGLWLGDYSAAIDKKSLNSHNIKTVLTAAAGLKVSYSDSITHKVLPVYDCDTENIGRYFEDSYSFICEGLERGNVYVHCFAGVSRSATIVVSFLMKKFQWGLTQALTYTKKKRRYIEPNPGFMRQLRRYQRALQTFSQNAHNSEELNVSRVTEKSCGLDSLRKTTSPKKKLNRSQGKENRDEPNVLKDRKKNLFKYKRPYLIQDIDRIYLSCTGLKKGSSLGKPKRKLPGIGINETIPKQF